MDRLANALRPVDKAVPLDLFPNMASRAEQIIAAGQKAEYPSHTPRGMPFYHARERKSNSFNPYLKSYKTRHPFRPLSYFWRFGKKTATQPSSGRYAHSE